MLGQLASCEILDRHPNKGVESVEGRHFLLLPVLLVVLVPSGDAVSQPLPAQPPGKLPSNLSPTFPRVAVDHVVTYASWRGWGPKGGDRVILYRHGSLVRADTDYIGSRRANEESQAEGYSNLATAAALSVTRDDKGSLSSVWIARGGPDDIPIYRRTIVATDDAETIAGERCKVWMAKHETNEGVASTSCITADGIVLRETVLHHNGSMMDERRATKVERRHVRPGEVLPPADALRWPTWKERGGVAPTAEGERVNYDLKLVGKKDGEFVTKVIRKTGAWYSEQDEVDRAVRTLKILGPGVVLSYYNRTYPQINISRGQTSILMDTRMFDSAPMSKSGEIILGESCSWFNAAVNVTDYGRQECRSNDQLPLRRDEYSWGALRVSWLATALSRGQTPPNSINPSSSLMDWAFWGWPELSRR